MSLVPIRDVAKYGVVTDRDPYDLPTSAWSLGVNARFRNGRITRAPVFRSVDDLGTTDPRYCFSAISTSGSDKIFIGYKNGRVFRYSGSETDYSITGFSDAIVDNVMWTHTTLADVLYVNREDRVPWKYGQADSRFVALAGWDSSWRCRLLRSCGGALVALNVTKGSTIYPTMVKTSSIPDAGNIPDSWDHTSLSTLATENTIAEMQGPIVDASNLGSALCIYGTKDTWLMQADGSTNVYRTDKLFEDRGAINANCSVEVNGKQYVFGPDDIWMHDGVSDQSVCDGVVREFIYATMNFSKRDRFFVKHSPTLKEITFHYVSADRLVRFSGGEGCNRAAVLNYVTNTWTFDDLPFVYSSARSNLTQGVTWATVTGTWEEAGGSWLDQDDGTKRATVYVGEANASAGLSDRLYAFDLYGAGSTVSFPVDDVATKGMYLERMGIDLDELGKELRGYVECNTIYPQARIDADAEPLIFTVGAADYYGADDADVEWSAPQTYNGREDYQLDFTCAGRWLAMKVEFNDYKYVSISGFDADFKQTGHA